MTPIHSALAVAGAALLLASCGSTAQTASPAAPITGTNRPADATTSATASPSPTAITPAPTTTPTPTPSKPSTLKFGEPSKFADGVQITVSAPEEFKPSKYAAKPDSPHYVKFKITVVNGSKEALDVVQTYATLQSGNTEADGVFDTEAKIGNPPSTPVLPGREATWVQAWGADNPADLVMSIAPGFKYEKVIYTS